MINVFLLIFKENFLKSQYGRAATGTGSGQSVISVTINSESSDVHEDSIQFINEPLDHTLSGTFAILHFTVLFIHIIIYLLSEQYF